MKRNRSGKKVDYICKLLIVGDSNSIWIYNFIVYILAGKEKRKIDLLCTDDKAGKWDDKYRRMNIRLIRLPEKLAEDRKKAHKTMLERISSIYQCIKFVNRLGEYDIINMQFVNPVFLLYFLGTKRIKDKLILSYWGSDLMRMSRDNELIEKVFLRYKKCAYMTFDNGDLEDLFFQKFPVDKSKGSVIMLSLPVLDWIDKTRLEDCKIISGQHISEDKIVIAIGYNGRQEQQHMKIIKALSKLEEKYKNEVLLILQMTYGGEEEYIVACESACKSGGLGYVLFKDFQMYEESARLRKRTDIFINAQTTDAFSGSFCEYMYADTIVLNAKWLHYRELDEHPFVYREFESFVNIPSILAIEIENIKRQGHGRKVGLNQEIIWELRSNENCTKKWNRIFNTVTYRNGNLKG